MKLIKLPLHLAVICLIGLVSSKPQHGTYQIESERGIEKQYEWEGEADLIVRKTRQVSTTSTPRTTTSTSTRIPPANPEVTTVYKVPCACPFTPQYDPVCGSDGQNYGNFQILNCARFCGSNVTLVYRNACGSNRG